MADTVEARIEELESLTSSVIEAIIRNDVQTIEHLVIEQVKCIRGIDSQQLSTAERRRLQALSRSIDTQQQLLGQALHVSEFFLERLSEARPFNRIG